MKRHGILLTVAIFLSLAGCGYRFVGMENRSGVNTIAIPLFLNLTAEAGLENFITNAVREKFMRSKRIKLVGEKEAEAVLVGTVQAISLVPVSLTREGLTLETRATVGVNVTLKRMGNGKDIWQAPNLNFRQDYLSNADFPTNERRKEEALRRIARELGEQIHNGILSQF